MSALQHHKTPTLSVQQGAAARQDESGLHRNTCLRISSAMKTYRFRLPEGVDDGTPLVSHHVVVPLPGLRVDGLSHRPQDLQRPSLVPADRWGSSFRDSESRARTVRGGARDSPLHRLVAVLHQQPDGGRSRVELGHAVLVHDLPHATDVRVGGQTLELKHSRHKVTGEQVAVGLNNRATEVYGSAV